MRIAIASGKGGTGKTTVATNLAYVAGQGGQSVAYVDCDVEEPNGHLFLKPEITERRPVEVLMPSVDAENCTRCGKCSEICQYSAIVRLPSEVLVFGELCHSCGGCGLACPEGAIKEVPRSVGVLESGRAGEVGFVQGILNVGEARGTPVIQAAKAAAPAVDLIIADASPGTSCGPIEAVRGSDYVILVAEPTPFGLSDLRLAVDMVRAIELPFGVVVNRADLGYPKAREFCQAERIDVLAEIPDDRRIAESYSRGVLACEAWCEYRPVFAEILEKASEAAGVEA